MAKTEWRDGMVCPQCGGGTKVKDSRPTCEFGGAIRRRRRCSRCSLRFTTYEVCVAYDQSTGAPVLPFRMKQLRDHILRTVARLNASLEAIEGVETTMTSAPMDASLPEPPESVRRAGEPLA